MGFKKEIKKLNREISTVEKNIGENIEAVEDWVIARRKFLIKLGWVVGFIGILLILSNLYLRTFGMGI